MTTLCITGSPLLPQWASCWLAWPLLTVSLLLLLLGACGSPWGKRRVERNPRKGRVAMETSRHTHYSTICLLAWCGPTHTEGTYMEMLSYSISSASSLASQRCLAACHECAYDNNILLCGWTLTILRPRFRYGRSRCPDDIIVAISLAALH